MIPASASRRCCSRSPTAGRRSGRRALYLSGEESAGQIRLRAERTGCSHDEVYLAAESDLQTALGHIEEVQPTLVVVDSVQTMSTAEADGVTGGVTQVRAVTTALTMAAKTTGVAMMLVGHVTKDGAIAGPRSLEHLVDVVLHFEGDRNIGAADGARREEPIRRGRRSRLFPVARQRNRVRRRSVRAVPGSAARTGAGTAVTVTLDGKRPLIGEVQALVGRSVGGQPRRAVSGIDSSRAAMITAVLEKRANLPVGTHDIYLSTVGGMRLTDPSSDLAVALAIASACADVPHARRPRSPSARSAWPAICAGSPAWTGGSPRPPGWASPVPSCRPASRTARGPARDERSDNIGEALQGFCADRGQWRPIRGDEWP